MAMALTGKGLLYLRVGIALSANRCTYARPGRDGRDADDRRCLSLSLGLSPINARIFPVSQLIRMHIRAIRIGKCTRSMGENPQ